MWLYCIAHFETLEQCLYEQRYIHPCFIPSRVVVALVITSAFSISRDYLVTLAERLKPHWA